MTAETTLGRRSGYLLKLYFFFNDPDRTDDGVSIYKYFEISETVRSHGLIYFHRRESFAFQNGLYNIHAVLLGVLIDGLPITHQDGIAYGI